MPVLFQSGGLLLLWLSCIPSAPTFIEKDIGYVSSPSMPETSGLGASRKHANILYTINDHGNINTMMAIDSTTGSLRAVYTIANTVNKDWEDLSVGVCGSSGGSCIYIPDTGNEGNHSVVYRLQEPDVIMDMTLNLDSTFKFTWAANDSETLMIDPHGNAYVIEKIRGGKGIIVMLPADGWGKTSVPHLPTLGRIQLSTHHPDPVGGDISPDGKEVLIKTHKALHYWSIPHGNYVTAFQQKSEKVPYHYQHQGESVCWSANGQGYYTLPEGLNTTLYYYARGTGTSIIGR